MRGKVELSQGVLWSQRGGRGIRRGAGRAMKPLPRGVEWKGEGEKVGPERQSGTVGRGLWSRRGGRGIRRGAGRALKPLPLSFERKCEGENVRHEKESGTVAGCLVEPAGRPGDAARHCHLAFNGSERERR